MKKAKRNADEVVRSLREADRDLAKGLTVSDICRRRGIAETTYDRWRQRYAPVAMPSAALDKTSPNAPAKGGKCRRKRYPRWYIGSEPVAAQERENPLVRDAAPRVR